MGRKGGKKKDTKESNQGTGGGHPHQAQAGQSSSDSASTSESKANRSCQDPSSHPTQRGGDRQYQQQRHGRGRGQAGVDDSRRGHDNIPRKDNPQQAEQFPPVGRGYQQQQQQQQQFPPVGTGYQQQQQQFPSLGRGHEQQQKFPPLGRGHQQQQKFPPLGRGHQQQQKYPPLGRGHQQQQQFPPVGKSHQQQQVFDKPAWGAKGVSSVQQLPQEQKPPAQKQEIPAKPKATLEEATKQISTISLKDEATSKPSPAKEVVHRPIEQLGIPKRKNPLRAGTTGQRIQVYTNMMEIKFLKNFKTTIIHYDVNIEPDKPKYLQRSIFYAAQKKLFPHRFPAFDGKKNVFSAGILPIDNPTTTEVTVINEDGHEKVFSITFQIANELDLSWLKNVKPGLRETERNQISLQALDIILRSAPALRATQVGRSFFTPPADRVASLGGGMDVWVGLFQSAVLGWKPLLNVDVAHKGFPSPQSVIELMKTICGCNGQYNRQNYNQGSTELTPFIINKYKEEIGRFLKGLKVVYEIPNHPTSKRTQRVNGLVKCPNENVFEHNNRQTTILQYYEIEKGYRIRYPQFPCLWVGNKNKNIHVPVELCTIVGGQATQKKLNESQTANMIKYAASGTEDRKRKIMDAFNHMEHNNDPCMKEFGISVSGEFEKVNARILDPPALAYQENNKAYVNKGVWRANKFLHPSQDISNEGTWTILNLNRSTQDRDLYHLRDELQNIGYQLGMSISEPMTPFSHIQQKGNDIRELISYFNSKKKSKLRLIIVIVPEIKGPYSKVKQISEIDVGILTQCLKGKTLTKLSQATTSNILLKINAKLNGINHKIAPHPSLPVCLTQPCMIVGADVTHPSPDATDIPSIAAVAASHDPCAFKYNIEIRLQPPRVEIIQDLTQIMITQLKFFYSKTKHKPLRIIFYRDGVSEGQFAQVMDNEIVAIRKACQSLQDNYKPAISFMVVQKRHHTRFFPTSSRDTDDKNHNVKAGTIVDTEITHPSDIDFYLVSHASIQGTARPTKYRCLHDDSNMSEDEIEQLTYFLCHMFSRCTRSVSYPTPTYYAHLAAFRARVLTQDVNINLNNLAQEQIRKLTLKEDVSKNTPMFFV